MDAENKNNIANEETELSKDEFCAFLEEKLNMEVEHEQAEEVLLCSPFPWSLQCRRCHFAVTFQGIASGN
jgi:hypothetical protein